MMSARCVTREITPAVTVTTCTLAYPSSQQRGPLSRGFHIAKMQVTHYRALLRLRLHKVQKDHYMHSRQQWSLHAKPVRKLGGWYFVQA